MKSKSAVRLFRKHILGPGKTMHSGRGFWMMYHNRSVADIRKLATEWVERNPDKVELFVPEDKDGTLMLRLAEGYGDRWDRSLIYPGTSHVDWYYRTLVVPRPRACWITYASVAM